jgi:hypothetical protein
MDKFLESLRRRGTALQASIDEEQARPAPDWFRLRVLKKLRLRYRDRIETAERMSRGGLAAALPVVRHRPFRAALAARM